jgi:hypothetical protein
MQLHHSDLSRSNRRDIALARGKLHPSSLLRVWYGGNPASSLLRVVDFSLLKTNY